MAGPTLHYPLGERTRVSVATEDHAMTIFAMLVSAALIVVALRDIFQQLFHPSGGASLN